MLVEAVNWNPAREPLTRAQILATPSLAHYVSGWPRPGDHGLIAENGQRVGAVWLRRFPADDPGYGSIAPDIPELSIGVAPDWRGKGIGRALIRAIVQTADQISLSVERANPARNFYLQEGFIVVSSGEVSDTVVKTIANA